MQCVDLADILFGRYGVIFLPQWSETQFFFDQQYINGSWHELKKA